MEATGNYLGLNFIRAPKKNHDAMERIGKPFVKWFKNHGVRTEIYPHLYTATSEQMEKARDYSSQANELAKDAIRRQAQAQ